MDVSILQSFADSQDTHINTLSRIQLGINIFIAFIAENDIKISNVKTKVIAVQSLMDVNI